MYKRYYDIDVDAKAYANNIVKAGGRIPSDIGSVSDFIRRLKQNNLWNNVICWPLRANQNAGTGSVAYSLGRLGTYNGTLINSPIWTPNGIVSTAGQSQSIQTNSMPVESNVFYYAVVISNVSGWTVGVPMVAGSNAINACGLAFLNTLFRVRKNSSPEPDSSAVNGWNAGHAQIKSGSQNCGINGSVSNSASNSLTLSGTMTYVMAQDMVTGTGNSTQAFSLMIINQDINPLVIHNIYKSTLGKGLGLP